VATKLYQAEVGQASGSLGYTGAAIENKSAVTKGVADAALVSTIGESALSAKKGVTVGKAQAADEQAVDQFFNKGSDQQALKTAVDDVGFFQEAADEGFISADSPLLAQAKDEATRLTQAAKSGALSTSELLLNLETKKRERIQQFPGYAQDFRKIYGEVLSDNHQRLKLAQEAEKTGKESYAYMDKTVRKDAHDMGMADAWSAPLESLIPRVAENNTSRYNYETFQQDQEIAKVEGAKGYQKSELGRITHFKTGMMKWAAEYQKTNGKPPSREEYVAHGNQFIDSIVGKDKQSFGNTVTNEMYNNTKTVMQSYLTDMDNVMSGKMTREQYENKNKTLEEIYTNKFLEDPTIGRLYTLGTKLPPDLARNVFSHVSEDPMGINAYQRLAQFGLYGGTPPPTSPIGDPSYKKGLQSYTAQNIALLKGNWEDYTPMEQQDITNMVSTQSQMLSDSRPSYGSEEADALLDFGSSDAYLQSVLNNPALDGSRKNLQLGVGRFVNDMNDQMMMNLQEDLDLQTGTPSRKARREGQKGVTYRQLVDVNFNADGMMSFSLKPSANEVIKDPAAIRNINSKLAQMNKGYASRFNKAVKAWAHASGNNDYGKASTDLMKQVNPDLLPSENGLRPSINMAIESTKDPVERMDILAKRGVTPKSYEEFFAITNVKDTPKHRLVMDQISRGVPYEELAAKWSGDPEVEDLLITIKPGD
jgi:hypothetical protein